MSKRIGPKRLQALVDQAYAVYPGGEVPQVFSNKMKYIGTTLTAVRLFTGESIIVDIVVRGKENERVDVEVHRRTTVLTWGREVWEEERLLELVTVLQRAAYIKGLSEAKR